MCVYNILYFKYGKYRYMYTPTPPTKNIRKNIFVIYCTNIGVIAIYVTFRTMHLKLRLCRRQLVNINITIKIHF